MMTFRALKTSIIDNILGPAEAGQFVTIGFQRQAKAAEEVLDSLRTVQVYYSSGDFNKSAGRINGPSQHDITFRIDLAVSKAAEGDLSVINNPESTQPQVEAAILAFQEAADLADQSIDELIEIVYQILMDAENIGLGLADGIVSNRWVDNIQKDNPLPRGEYAVLTASMILTCRVAEAITGIAGTAANIFDTTVDIDGDDVEKTGVTVDNT